MSHQVDYLSDDDKDWLRKSRRSAARRSWLLIGLLVLAALFLAWLTVDGPGSERAAPTTTTPEQRAIADGNRALADWGRFAVTNDLRTVKDSFWANGPQYKQLAREAKTRKPIKGPSYTMTMSGVEVIPVRDDQRVLRGKVQMARPGEKPQNFNWDVWLQLDPEAGGRWRLWTVGNTPGS
jgi:hypothetical protein